MLEKFIQDIENGIILTKEKNRYAKDSIKIYRTLLNNLVMYEYLHETEIRFDVIDINFYDDFVLFLYNEQDCNELNLEKEAYVPSSVGKYIKTLKRILKYAYEKKLTTNTEFKNDYFTAPKGKAFSVALDMDELNRLYNLKLSGNNEIIRDVFLVGCYTGLRYSDYKKVKPENIMEVEKDGHKITVLNVNMQKVKDSVSIPLVDQCLKIVQKYGYNMPEVNSVKLNKAIKSICEKAKIDDKIEYTTYKGGIETIQCKSKYEMVASHTARRSAITNLYYYYHLTYEEIMKISGHKSIDMLRLYIKISEIENAKIVGIKMINKNNNK